eukprot:263484_1
MGALCAGISQHSIDHPKLNHHHIDPEHLQPPPYNASIPQLQIENRNVDVDIVQLINETEGDVEICAVDVDVDVDIMQLINETEADVDVDIIEMLNQKQLSPWPINMNCKSSTKQTKNNKKHHTWKQKYNQLVKWKEKIIDQRMNHTRNSSKNCPVPSSKKNGIVKIKDCLHFERFESVMVQYSIEKNMLNEQHIDITLILNDFLFLHNNYKDNDQFEFIYNELGGYCNMNSCEMFRRNYRNRKYDMDMNQHSNSTDTISKQQILDKLHCFYHHSFDIGYKLHSKENSIGYKLHSKEEHILTNYKIMQMHQHLSKHQTYARSNKTSNILHYSKAKFNQFYMKKDENYKMYSFGIQFKYGYHNEDTYMMYNDEKEWTEQNAINVSPKYKSLKEELTNNNISTISINQFDIELKKAHIHFDTDYRKEMYSKVKIEHLLSLMIYCNQTELQNKFSETYYRNISEHNNFF